MCPICNTMVSIAAHSQVFKFWALSIPAILRNRRSHNIDGAFEWMAQICPFQTYRLDLILLNQWLWFISCFRLREFRLSTFSFVRNAQILAICPPESDVYNLLWTIQRSTFISTLWLSRIRDFKSQSKNLEVISPYFIIYLHVSFWIRQFRSPSGLQWYLFLCIHRF